MYPSVSFGDVYLAVLWGGHLSWLDQGSRDHGAVHLRDQHQESFNDHTLVTQHMLTITLSIPHTMNVVYHKVQKETFTSESPKMSRYQVYD